MLLFDAHLDLAMNAVDWNRDLRMSIDDIRVQEQLLGLTDLGRQTNTVSFPELQKAEVRLGVATLIARQEQAINHPLGMTTAEACYAMCHAHLAYYRAMERHGWMKGIRTRSQLAMAMDVVNQPTDTTPFHYILSMECADAVLSPDDIHEWYGHGLRAIGLTHYGTNRYGGGTRTEVGLTLAAIPLLQEIEKLSMAVDMTHLSDVAFWQVADRFNGPVLASHQNARKFCDWQRQFSDEQLKFVISRNGVIGMALDAIMLQPGWVRGVTKPVVTLDRVIENIDHICQLAGHARCVGIGSDLDGGFGYEQTPADVNTIADMQKLPVLLEKKGYSETDIGKICHGNWCDFFSRVLPE
jgi:membrane dipeptidase